VTYDTADAVFEKLLNYFNSSTTSRMPDIDYNPSDKNTHLALIRLMTLTIDKELLALAGVDGFDDGITACIICSLFTQRLIFVTATIL
jgi:hypothetical protein